MGGSPFERPLADGWAGEPILGKEGGYWGSSVWGTKPSGTESVSTIPLGLSLGKGCSLGGTTESHGYHALPRYAPPVGHSPQVAVRMECLYSLIEAQ